MYNPANKQLTFVMYDSIENAIFQTMVLKPLLTLIEQSENLEITLISFEKKQLSPEIILEKIPTHEKLHFISCSRLSFFGRLSLYSASVQLKRILNTIPSHHLIARGALAGLVCMKAIRLLAKKSPDRLRKDNHFPFPPLTIQARGLHAEEYRFATSMKSAPWWRRPWSFFIYRELKKVEFEVYRSKRKNDYPNTVLIEVVSPELKNYLVQTFRAEQTKITLATHDLPKSISVDQRASWKEKVREKLSIPSDYFVYGYTGSGHSWQCVPEMIFYFLEQYAKNHKVFFLVLTPDTEVFQAVFKQTKMPEDNYLILSIAPHEVYEYLSACDAGLLFRRQDVINWVSRPTKMLEYQAVGLPIIHNHTVAWLKES